MIEERTHGASHEVAALIRVIVCTCGWQARSDQVSSLDEAFRHHQTQAHLAEFRQSLALGPPETGR
jgi:hypothetical protein